MNPIDARALLAQKLKAHLANPDYPLSYPQQRPWFLDQLQKDNPVYNLPLGYRVQGPLDAVALRFALGEVVRRHDVLRSVFRTIDGVPRQVVKPATEVELAEVDLRGQPDALAQARLLLDEEAATPFDLATGPMLRAKLVHLAPQDCLFLLSLHHIACDAWSVGIIAREVSELYRARLEGRDAALPPLKLQYVDFTEWQTRLMKGPARQELIDHWRQRLAGIPSCINLPTDRPRPPIQDYHGAHVAFDLPTPLVEGIDTLARQEGTTPYAVLLSAFAALLNRYTGDDQIVIGTPVANRHEAEVEPLVGFFTNTLVLRPDLSGDPDFRTLVSRVGAETREALAHQDLPFEILVEELRPDRDTAHSPVFQVMLIYWDGDDDATWSLPGCSLTTTPGDSRTAKFDLTLSLTRTASGIRARLEYASSIFDEATVQRFAGQYTTLLEQALATPAASVRQLRVLPAAESQQLLADLAHGPAAPASGLTVSQAIEAQVQRTPQAVAVVDGRQEWTYDTLDKRAAALAARLARHGVSPGSVVGVYLDRSVDTLAALLGILKAGAGYLPLDPAYPAERLAFMREDSGAVAVVSRRSLAGQAAALGGTVLCIDEPGAEASHAAVSEASLDDLAYLIYTSGSTGKPKGVMLTHRNVDTFFAAMNASFGADAPGTWLAVTSISFDISVLELLWTLTRGYRVVIRGDEASTAGASTTPATKVPEFSLFYFGNAPAEHSAVGNRYRLVMEGARFADVNGFSAVWTPERHFHPFGGLFPNPSVLSAAIAAVTERISIRAGSVVLPLHDPLRVAEEWSVVDNLSGGRIGVSFASGWQPDDFVLAPGQYAERKQIMMNRIEEVRRLWRGDKLRRVNGAGREVEVGVYPRPVQQELPIWVTSARHPDTFRLAGEAGARLLTHLVGHTPEQLAEKIALYRRAWREHGWAGEGHVTLMLHTFVHPDLEFVRATVRGPLREYIRSSFDLMAGLGTAMNVDVRSLPTDELEGLLDGAFERFFESSALLGTPEMVARTVQRLAGIGVDEVGCLIDFGVGEETTLAALPHLAAARALIGPDAAAPAAAPLDEQEPVAEQLRRHQVTHLQCTPSLARMLVSDPGSREALRPLKRLLVGGEAMPPDLADALASAVGGSVHNMYGPTEATVWATTSPLTAGAPVHIGRPLPGYEAYVVDAELQPAPIGVPGELLLGGPAVARGYHRRPELTAERFPAHRFGGSGALYRTGDLVRWRASGELEFLGRLDNQVKLRGRRIELGEIEAALAEHPAIAAAVADVRGSGDARGIVAYCTLAPGAQMPAADVLRTHLARTLPDHMLPAAFMALDAFPLTPNGKVNRRALPDAQHARPQLSTVFEAPEGELEERIAAIWREVLGIAQVGVRDNFFELGGNSILAVAVRSKLLATVDDRLALIDMFRYPSVRALAAAIEARRGSPEAEPQAGAWAQQASQRRREALSRMAQRKAAPSQEVRE
jgi:natural product biosynthesis luciferase-like monooxygenase protein